MKRQESITSSRPVQVIRVTVGQERGHGFSYFLVGEDVPEAVGPHHQHIVSSVLILCQVIYLHLRDESQKCRLSEVIEKEHYRS